MNTALLLLCLGSFFLCNCHSSIISDNKPSSHVSINRHDTLANCNGINDVGSNNNVSSNGGINNVNVTSAFEIAFSITPSNIRLLVVCISLQINLDTNSSIDWTFDLLPPLESFDSQNSQNSQNSQKVCNQKSFFTFGYLTRNNQNNVNECARTILTVTDDYIGSRNDVCSEGIYCMPDYDNINTNTTNTNINTTSKVNIKITNIA